jgi:hypothetical protein
MLPLKLHIHDQAIAMPTPYARFTFTGIAQTGFDVLPEMDGARKARAKLARPKALYATLALHFAVCVQRTENPVHAMDNDIAEDFPPREHRVQVNWIEIARQLGKLLLICHAVCSGFQRFSAPRLHHFSMIAQSRVALTGTPPA